MVGVRGVLGVPGKAGGLKVKEVVKRVEIFRVGGHRGDLGGTEGAGIVEVVMAKGCGIEVRKIAPRGS